MPDRWAVRDEWHTALDTLKKVESALQTRRETTFPETSEGAPHTHTANAEKRFYAEVERLAAEEREEVES